MQCCAGVGNGHAKAHDVMDGVRRRAAGADRAGISKGDAPVRKWTVEDVSRLLEKRGLRAAAEVFQKHEIDGEVLLSLGEHDLDYMAIRALGTRKKILAVVRSLSNKPDVVPSATPVHQSANRTVPANLSDVPGGSSSTAACMHYAGVLLVFFALHWACNDMVLSLFGIRTRFSPPTPTPMLLSQLEHARARDSDSASTSATVLNTGPPP